MESYHPLYRIIVKHEYFEGKQCSFLQCSLSPQGMLLARQRGLLFRQVMANEWEVLYDAEGAGVDTLNDVLELELSITDCNFVLYTDWKNFNPSISYVLELPLSAEESDAVSAICPAEGKRKIGSPFCTIRLHLTEKLVQSAKAKTPEVCTLHFHTPTLYWEYIFVPHNEDDNESAGDLLLEDTTGKITFCPLYKTQAYGREVWRTKSVEGIPLRSVFGCRLRLVVKNEKSLSKRLLLRQVRTPELGRFQSERLDCLRQVCYY